MPTYEYECSACGHRLEAFQPFSQAPLRKCPECRKQKLVRLISAGGGLIFKGSGFYITDYRDQKSYQDAAKADAAPSAPKTEGKTEGGKPADGKSAESKPGDSKPAGPKGKDGRDHVPAAPAPTRSDGKPAATAPGPGSSSARKK